MNYRKCAIAECVRIYCKRIVDLLYKVVYVSSSDLSYTTKEVSETKLERIELGFPTPTRSSLTLVKSCFVLPLIRNLRLLSKWTRDYLVPVLILIKKNWLINFLAPSRNMKTQLQEKIIHGSRCNWQLSFSCQLDWEAIPRWHSIKQNNKTTTNTSFEEQDRMHYCSERAHRLMSRRLNTHILIPYQQKRTSRTQG